MKRLLAIFGLVCAMTASSASERYFLCGTDEDGCGPGQYRWCACIPYDDGVAASPYCLRFDTLSCVPLRQAPDCPKRNVYHDQGTCLAVAWQSEAKPGCRLVETTFCTAHHVPLCQRDGGQDSCISTAI